MVELIRSIFVVLTILMWIDLILSFISKTFNEIVIKSLEEQNIIIEKMRKRIKSIFSKVFKN